MSFIASRQRNLSRYPLLLASIAESLPSSDAGCWTMFFATKTNDPDSPALIRLLSPQRPARRAATSSMKPRTVTGPLYQGSRCQDRRSAVQCTREILPKPVGVNCSSAERRLLRRVPQQVLIAIFTAHLRRPRLAPRAAPLGRNRSLPPCAPPRACSEYSPSVLAASGMPSIPHAAPCT